MKNSLKRVVFKFQKFSKKQRQVLNWWSDSSPVKDYNGIICDGAIRSGKTVAMSLSFVMWAMERFDGKNFAMCGKTIGSFKRNVWLGLKLMLWSRGYTVEKYSEMGDNVWLISINGHTNVFYIFGGRDESSQDLIQGLTLAGLYLDEVVLMPESFVNQATGRCSVTGAKVWMNCNPENPLHYIKVDWIDKADAKHMLHLTFYMDDNLSLSEERKQWYLSNYKGVFFKRFILSLWCIAEGAIYDMVDDDNYYDDGDGPDYNLWCTRYYTMDYGTTNPCAIYEIIHQGNMIYIENEYYYDSKKEMRQKEDSEYADDLIKFIDGKSYTCLTLDPSAASFKITARARGIRVKEADNEVLDGIRLVASLIALKRLKINKKCVNLINELAAYVWDEKAAKRGEEKPVKVSDHGCDAIRYHCKTIIKRVA